MCSANFIAVCRLNLDISIHTSLMTALRERSGSHLQVGICSLGIINVQSKCQGNLARVFQDHLRQRA